jgi:chaperone modulatory protein CbpM
VYELVEEGIIDPLGREPSGWRFRWTSVRRVRCALRLEHDLGVNLAGAALALDLLEELTRLRAQLRRLG